ncbi:MAG: DUF86 domain-containing protein [Actinobacteria bacterium]|nr:DUF86 domain-containing protein [Actinomycetota bacterium]
MSCWPRTRTPCTSWRSGRPRPSRTSSPSTADTWRPSSALDRERVLAKLDLLQGYLTELRAILPADFEVYRRTEIRRACERLIQITIEAAIDTCGLLVAGLRLGLPGEEDDLFEKLAVAGVVSEEMAGGLRRMKGLRNILVHEYARVDDRIVYETLHGRLPDLEEFARQVTRALREGLA